MSREILYERSLIVCAALLAADAVESENKRQTEAAEKCRAECDYLRIRGCGGRSEQLYSELIKLAVSARLRLLVAEAVDYVVEPQRHCAAVETVFDDRARNRCSALGTKRYAAPLLSVVKGVHLLLNNVGGVAYAALKQLGILDGRKAYLAEAVKSSRLARDRLNVLPFFGVTGKNVIRTVWFLYHFCIVLFLVFSLRPCPTDAANASVRIYVI